MSGEEPGYVPPDHTTTVEFRRPAPEGERAEPDTTAPDPPESGGPPAAPEPAADVTAPDPPDEVEGALDPDDRRVAGQPAPDGERGTAPSAADGPGTMTNPVVPGFGPQSPRAATAARPRRYGVITALAAAVLVMLVALGAVSLLSGGGSDEDPAPQAPAVKTTRASGRPSPSRPARRGPAPAEVPVGTVVTGDGITFQVVQRDEGYYEGRLVIANRTRRPMNAWRVSFDAPGADVRNVWEGRLVRGGSHPIIEGAGPIPPGGTLDVQYGASGVPTTPGRCLLNGAACGF
ncbi:cellulose binding domain-containing protein [Actinomadura sp. NTSP31]|uniref:cellulose binding domain-containing protein n=1 Tax=Actinomadura sp. NTSP31 TaxID=1735447 RepID=UPI0035C074A8